MRLEKAVYPLLVSRLARQRRKRRNQSGPGKVLLLTFGILTVCLAIGGLSAVGYVVSTATSGPSLSDLKPQDQGSTSVVYASDRETRLGFIQSDILRTPLASKDIPEVVRQATVAIEDRRFFEHKGVDLEGVVRAAIKNIESGEEVQGGSTITMQLVRNLYTGDRDRTFKRKIREARLAEELEDLHPGREGKLWILNKYINNVPYGTVGGQSAIGVQAAARIFFNKPAKELALHEAALLAGLPQLPSLYNPITAPEKAKARRDDVLRRMAAEGFIGESEAQEAIARDLDVQPGRYYTFRREGYFFDYVKQELIDRYGVDRVRRGGMRIYTSIDLELQRHGRKVLDKAVAGTDRAAAITTVDTRTGFIKAMVPSVRYGELKFNLAAQGKRQPGSTFKIMTLMAALRRGVDPDATSYTSMPLNFNDPQWGPIKVKTYSNSYIGRANLRRATVTSDNSIYQQLALDIGPKEVAKTARDMGVKTKLDGYPAESLGGLRIGVSPLEMANSYATIANGGWRNRATAIVKVCFPEGAGKFDCRETKTRRTKVFPDGVTAKATDIMRDNMTGGTGTSAQIGCPAAGKTGTTDNSTDAWFVGYTPRLSTAVWVGHANDKRSLGPGAAGGVVAAPLWGEFMKVAKRDFCGDFPKPKEPFSAVPFFGKYSKSGVRGNKVDRDYSIVGTDQAGDLERTGRKKPTSQQYPEELYESAPQPAPETQEPQADPGPAPGTEAPAPVDAQPASPEQQGGTAPPP